MPVTIIDERPLGSDAPAAPPRGLAPAPTAAAPLPAVARGTVLFADLRGYTSLAERLPALEVLGLLAALFERLGRVVAARGGHVFHVAGDALMAGFGFADDAATRPAARAFLAGRELLAAFAPFDAEWQARFGLATGLGVGLHCGEAALGPLGPGGATLIGDTVNVAARLCQRARAGEVLFSADFRLALESDAEALPDGCTILPLPAHALRGRIALLGIYCVPAARRAPA